jgi:hypothetical protein
MSIDKGSKNRSEEEKARSKEVKKVNQDQDHYPGQEYHSRLKPKTKNKEGR